MTFGTIVYVELYLATMNEFQAILQNSFDI